MVPVEEKNGRVNAGTPVTISDANRSATTKRDLQGRSRIATSDGQKFRLSVIPSVPKITEGAAGPF